MGADKVGGQIVSLAKLDELRDPLVVGRGGTAHFEIGIDVLDGSDGFAIELEIIFASPGPERLQIRFVPDLEEPLSQLR